MNRKKSNVSTVISLALGALVLLLLFNPEIKTWVSQGLMKIGWFKPDLAAPVDTAKPADARNLPVWISDGAGNRIDIANQQGKVVFVNFWATWCRPCITELPSIDKLYKQFEGNGSVVFAMVDVDGQLEKSTQFMENRKLRLPVHVPAGQIPSDWLQSAIPTTVILDKQGRIAARHEGMADYSRPEVAEFIDQLIAAD